MRHFLGGHQFVMLLGCSALALGCAESPKPSAAHVWLDPTLSELLQNPQAQLQLPKPALLLQGGVEVSSCEGYLARASDPVESAANFAALSHYLVCDAIDLAQRWPAEVAGAELAAPENLALCSTVDLASFHHSLRPQIDASRISMVELFQGAAQSDLYACRVSDPKQYFEMQAKLLIAPPGEPQRLWVWVSDEILDGKYRAYHAQWFGFDSQQGMWVAQE